MFYYGNRKDQDEEITRQAKKRRAAADAFPHLRDVLTAFDGKVFNVRFQNALNEGDSDNRYFVNLRRSPQYGDLLVISIHSKWDHNYTDDCCIVSVNLGTSGKWDGKRLPSAVVLESARERRAELLKEAAALEEITPARIDELCSQVDQLTRMIDALRESVPYSARNVYRLNWHVSNS